jgi:hypothetical protein
LHRLRSVTMSSMKAGVYASKKSSRDDCPPGYVLLIGLARGHSTNEEVIAYVPLRVEPEWSGTARMAFRAVDDFNEHFEWVGERLP